MRLFRFFDARGGIATLRDRQFRLSDPQNLNDPFEITPRLTFSSVEDFENRLRDEDRIRRHYEVAKSKTELTYEQFRNRHLSEIVPKLVKDFKAQSDDEKASKLRASCLRGFAQHFRILCASRTRDSILMWSHYASNHKGIVVEFETAEISERRGEYDHMIFEVCYRTSPPPSTFFATPEEFSAEAADLTRTKALQWSYEEEVRIRVSRLLFGGNQYLPFRPESIKSVAYGCRIEECVLNRAKEVLSDKCYTHVQSFKAVPHPREYSLTFEELPGSP